VGNTVKGVPEPQSVGTWRLINRIFEVQDTGENTPEAWTGRMIVQANGAFVFIMTKADRTAPVTADDHVAAHATMVAASGRVWVEGGQPFVAYEVASHPQLLGREPVTTQFSGNRMYVTGVWSLSGLAGNRIARTRSEWERE
jgi:hypothetical protein